MANRFRQRARAKQDLERGLTTFDLDLALDAAKRLRNATIGNPKPGAPSRPKRTSRKMETAHEHRHPSL